ncbi:MAG: acyl-CoA carboxylase epsilon subunit [Motilibacteraceae bacterium]
MSEAQQPEQADQERQPERPVLRVVRGAPDEAELAALVAVVAALPTGAPASQPPAPSRWTDRTTGLRRPLHPGPDAWRWSARTGR